jgi:hypothetical protein
MQAIWSVVEGCEQQQVGGSAIETCGSEEQARAIPNSSSVSTG